MIWDYLNLTLQLDIPLTGLPKPYVTVGYTPDGIPIVTPLIIILFLGFPVLGLILLVLGIVLNRIKKS